MLGSRFNPVKQRNPSMTEKIWGHYYRCLVPALRSRSVEDIRERGVIVTGIRDMDEALKDEWTPVDKTIDQMIELFKRGVPIRVVKDSEVKDIYDTVQTHLFQWLELLRTGLNLGDAPIDDLMAMDKFAAALYPHAKHMFTKDTIDSVMAEHMGRVQRFHAGNLFNSIPKVSNLHKDPIKASEDEVEDLPDRQSLEDRFKQSMMNMRKY